MAKKTKTVDENRPNSLGLRDKELNALLNHLDQAKKGTNAGRVFSRWQYHQSSIPVQIINPAGNEMDVSMICRNLSKGGIGLLHRSYLHLGTLCNVTLQHPIRGDVIVPGKVVRCIHLSGMIHEIGIAFDEDIDIRELMRPDPMQEMMAIETIDPQTLVGTILLVEDSEMDSRLVRHFLRDTQLRIKHVTTIAEAEKEVKSGIGLVLCDIHLGDENGGDFARKLYEHTSATPPVVMTSADTGESTTQLVTCPCVKGFLAKPFTQENLVRCIAEFLTDPVEIQDDEGSGTIQADRQLIEALLPELKKTADRLDEAMKAEDVTLVMAILMQIKGVAPVIGISELSMLSETMAQQLAANLELEAVRGRIEDVIRIAREASDHV